MIFNSFDFAIFLLVVWVLHWATPSQKLRQAILLAASLLFYGWWDWRFLGLIVGVSFVVWAAALAHERAEEAGRPRLALWAVRLGVALPLLVLAFFKYTLFLVESVAAVAAWAGWALVKPEWSIILPMGVSFFTFQAISYVIDVKRGDCPAEKSFATLLFYIAFFPQLVAGPIVTAAHFLPQTKTARLITPDGFVFGLKLVLWGLLQKAVFSDALDSWATPVFAAPWDYTLAARWAGAIAFAGQIYFDFAGYSTIAIGLGKTFGYELPINFQTPYAASTVTDFWRRWHITLGAWLRSYLFIPLGGNRHHYYRNLMITMVLGGLWHGASWNFVLWGALHGLALCTHKLWQRTGIAVPVALSWMLTQLIVLVAWVPFRAKDLSHTLQFFTPSPEAQTLPWPDIPLSGWWLALPLIIDAMLSKIVFTPPVTLAGEQPSLRSAVLTGAILASLLILILALGTWKAGTFIYFQF